MIRISLPYIWSLSERLEPLLAIEVADRPYRDNILALYHAKSAMDELLEQSVFSATLRSSRQYGMLLQEALKNINQYDFEQIAPRSEIFAIQQSYRNFRTALGAEFSVMPSYLVRKQAGFDTLTLLDAPDRLFPADLRVKVPEAIFDVR